MFLFVDVRFSLVVVCQDVEGSGFGHLSALERERGRGGGEGEGMMKQFVLLSIDVGFAAHLKRGLHDRRGGGEDIFI